MQTCLETQVTERLSIIHIEDMIDMEMSTFEITLMAVTIGGGVINRDCVITFMNKRDVYLSGSSGYFN